MTRLFAALIGVDVLFAAVGAILIHLRTREPDFVLPPPGQEAAMTEALRADAAGAVEQWWLLAMVVLTAWPGSRRGAGGGGGRAGGPRRLRCRT